MRFLPTIILSILTASAAMAQTPRTHITFVTDWKAQAEHGGFYEALAEGFYAKRGLDVTLRAGGPQVNVPQLLAGGAADFGIGSNSFIALNLVKQNVPLRAVMAIFQKDPQVLISHPRRDLTSLEEMRGRPILISDAAMTSFWPWLKARWHFSDSQIRKYTFNLAPFLVDPNAIQEGYLTSEPFTVEQQGRFAPKVFLLADYGYPGYANMVLVPQKWIDEKPQVVQAFVEASIEGWMRYIYGDPSPGNALIKRDNPEMTDDLIAQAIEKLRGHGIALSGEAQTQGLGAMTDARWKEFYDVMSKEGIYPAGLDYRRAYTLQFINRGYGLNLVPPDAQQQPPPAP